MILKAPTGLYSRLLPIVESDSTAVTYTISNNDPPPPPLIQTVVAPRSVVYSIEPPAVYHRADYGDLVFSVVEGKRSTTGSNKKAFEAGEIINFDDTVKVSSSVSTNKLTIQHNTNVLDLSSLGLTQDEIDTIADESDKMADLKRAEVSSLQTQISDIKIMIRENQKIINECNKAIKAVTVTFSGASGSDILDKLTIKLSDLELERSALNDQLTQKSTDLTAAQDELIDISQVVR